VPRLRLREESAVLKARRFGADAIAAVLLAILQIVLYRKVVRLWWTYDDPNNLRTIGEFPFLAPFLDGRVWPQQLFTPLMLTVFDVELALFGLDTAKWYAAQLAIAIVTSLAVYAAVRQFVPVSYAFAGAAMFAAGAPLCAIVTQLSTVHYFVAITFCALSVICYQWSAGVPPAEQGASRSRAPETAAGRRLLSRRDAGAPLSALFYLLAMLAKEVAVPLPLLLFALRPRARSILPHTLALIAYFAWRYAVLGTFLGAYSWVIEPGEWPRLIALLPWRVIRAMGGANIVLGMFVIGCIAITFAIAIRGRRAWLLMLAGAIVAIGPILPVAKEVNRRYVVVPWLALSVAFAIAVVNIRDRRLRIALLVLVPLLTIAANRQEWGREFGMRQRMSDEAKFSFDMPPNGLLRKPITPSATMRELGWLKTYAKKPAGSSWFYDDFYLCDNRAAAHRVWEYDPRQRMIVEVTPRIPAIASKHCGSIRNDVPLTARFEFKDEALHWDLGPYEEGRYAALVANGWEAFEIPRSEALHLPGMTGLTLRIRYDSPEGWTTYSPDLPLDFVHRPNYAWQR
jgi:hypothetical protein